MKIRSVLRRKIREGVLSSVERDVLPGGRVLEIGGEEAVSLDLLSPSFRRSITLTDFFERKDLDDLDDDWDIIICHFLTDSATDIHRELGALGSIARPRTRIILVTYNRLYVPVLRFLAAVGLKGKSETSNYLSLGQLRAFAANASLRTIKQRAAYPLLLRKERRFRIGMSLNYLLPFQTFFAPLKAVICRLESHPDLSLGVSIIVPARNESGNILRVLQEIPRFATWQELIFVEGGSSDDTWEKLAEVKNENAFLTDFDHIVAIQQTGIGKGNAVREGIKIAKGDIVAVFDADLSVSGTALEDFFELMLKGKCEFVNGTRMVYDKEKNAMQFLNVLGNKIFAGILSRRTAYRFSDVLCGTKMFFREDYENTFQVMQRVREADPFGDFELLLGMSRQSLELAEFPVRYQARTYGSTNISRFRDGGRLVTTILRSSSLN